MDQVNATDEQPDMLQGVAETSLLMDIDSLNEHEKNVRKTVMLYHGDNDLETQQDVADELDVTRQTVDRRLNSDEARQFYKIFSHRDKEEFDRWLEEIAAKHYNKAMKAINAAINRANKNEDVSPQILHSAGMNILRADEQFAKNLQEFGIIQKPKERKEVEKTEGSDEIREELAEYYEEKMEADNDA